MIAMLEVELNSDFVDNYFLNVVCLCIPVLWYVIVLSCIYISVCNVACVIYSYNWCSERKPRNKMEIIMEQSHDVRVKEEMVPNCHERSSHETLIIIFDSNDVEMMPIWMEENTLL